MKKTTYIVLTWCMLLGACQENEQIDFDSSGAVYFQIADSWSDLTDSIVYSFAGKESDEQTLNIQVNLMGEAVDYERHVRVAVDLERTTAKEGLHYQALGNEYILPANAYNMSIPVVLYGKDTELENRTFQLVVNLEPSDDLELGLADKTSVRVVISNMLTQPSYWQQYYLGMRFGPYSRVKHEYIIRVLGFDFPADAEEFAADQVAWQAYGKYMDTYIEEHYPIYDEHGNPIEPWL